MATAPSAQTGEDSRPTDQYIVAINVPYVPELHRIAQVYDPSSCVSYVKYKRPDLNEVWVSPKVYASTHELFKTPWVGAVGISSEGAAWHAWYVEAVEEMTLTVSEANFLGDFVSTRSLDLDSVVIRGFR